MDEVDKDHVELSWTPPTRDGGSKITGYIVEKKKVGNPDWEPASIGQVQGPSARIDNLDEGSSYEFRVKAVNAAGPGAPSISSGVTKIEPKKSKLYELISILMNAVLT